ncbi:2-5A-dependent ribonuclease isoform X2 [Sphaerodactylus townsendi]|uniref:2-5A-dependent ribonuclease isoform X2 n=1 Tax=Sphaerodactylus townsendi TaxID=933632 RepID=UPI002025E9FD|nr:2-5A-dependent ribonuclease isoform X2 [Sphaerodactylus townsendi]
MAADKGDQLSKAVQEGSIEKVQELLEEGIDINFKMNFGWTALLSAVQGDKEDLVHFLLDNGADPCTKKDNGATPFIVAGITGNVTLLELFLSKGSDIDEHDDNGFTAFMEAAWYGNERALRFLHHRGADVNLRRIVDEEKRALNAGGATALMDAAKKGHFVIVQALVEEMKADVNICDNQDRNALIHALSVSPVQPWSDAKEAAALFLLKKGIDTTKRDEGGKTTLILAVEHQSQELVKVILEKDEVDIDDADKNSQTALMVAVEKRNSNIARMLCEKSARTDIGNLMEIANRTYNNDMRKLLCQYGATAKLSWSGSNQMQWISSSRRWGLKFQVLCGMYRPMIGKLKIFMCRNFKIQRTSQGGVYVGFYDGEEVAVKVFHISAKTADKERTCLEKCRSSNHLVKYYGSEERKTCLYLCFAPYEENLEEYFGRAGNIDVKSKYILKTIFQAVQELHAFGFGHQDLHPSNILIDVAGKVFLADFDKSKKLISSDAEKNLIITEDLQALERLVLYIAMRGRMRFEDLPTKCPTDIANHIEIEDLRASLKSPEEKTPVSDRLEHLIQHPYFWSNQTKYRFLRDVGNDTRNAEQNKALNGDETHFKDWMEKIDKEVLDCIVYHPLSKKKYKNNVTDLLRLIRNLGEHLHEQSNHLLC